MYSYPVKEGTIAFLLILLFFVICIRVQSHLITSRDEIIEFKIDTQIATSELISNTGS
jgi:hypothetical protein